MSETLPTQDEMLSQAYDRDRYILRNPQHSLSVRGDFCQIENRWAFITDDGCKIYPSHAKVSRKIHVPDGFRAVKPHEDIEEHDWRFSPTLEQFVQVDRYLLKKAGQYENLVIRKFDKLKQLTPIATQENLGDWS